MADGSAVMLVEQVAADWVIFSQTRDLINPRSLVPILPDCGSSEFLIGRDWMNPLPTGASVDGSQLQTEDTEVSSSQDSAVKPEDIMNLCPDLPAEWKSRVFRLLEEYIDVFRTG